MDFTLLFQRFAEQSPLIIGCGLVIWQLLKMYKEEKALLRTERQECQKEIKGLIESHTVELRELNKYTRERDLETQESLNGAVVAIESIHQLIDNKFRLLD